MSPDPYQSVRISGYRVRLRPYGVKCGKFGVDFLGTQDMRVIKARIAVLAAAVFAMPFAMPMMAEAQQAVEVDLSVIEKIKRPVAVGSEPIVLRPPVDGEVRKVVKKRRKSPTRLSAKKPGKEAATPGEAKPKQAGTLLPKGDVTGAEKAEKQSETASVPKAPPPPPPARLSFAAGSAELQAPAAGKLGNVRSYLAANPATRVQISGYAPGTGTEAGAARRLSLARARSVQSWLTGQGIDPSRIVVRALGNKAGTANPDRVDVSILEK